MSDASIVIAVVLAVAVGYLVGHVHALTSRRKRNR